MRLKCSELLEDRRWEWLVEWPEWLARERELLAT